MTALHMATSIVKISFFLDIIKLWDEITHRNNACTQSFLLDFWSKFYAKFVSQTVNSYDETVYDFQNL